MEKNKSMWVWAGVVVVIVLVLLFMSKNKQAVAPDVTNPAENTATVGTEPESVQDLEPSPVTSSAITLSYANALVKYADRRIQLDKTCQAHPFNVTYKDNTGIMMDNRSPNTRTIKVGTTFTIKPWSFKIVVLPDVYLKSKTLLVDCDKYQNVATVLVQE
ncbi:MAG: hypothetical protein V4439_03980 [Patescibacteria group bacterium]